MYDAAGKQIAEYSTIVVPSGSATVSYLTNDHLGSPRINTDANGAVISRHDYHPFGEEIDGTGGRTTGLNYGDDGVRKQFTGYERDVETGLDFAQARMYANRLGRFNSADPLFIELKRLGDPQQMNLYIYTRNSPTICTDSSGLDIEVKGQTQDDYMRRLQGNLSFSVRKNATTDKVVIVGTDGKELDAKGLKTLKKSLEKTGNSVDNRAERELFKAITDTKNHVVINTVAESGDVDFGRFDGGGQNTIDSSDLLTLDNTSDNGGLTANNVVGHETLEAYHSAINGTQLANMAGSHYYANKFFAGIGVAQNPKPVLTQSNGLITHAAFNFSLQDQKSQATNTTIRIERQYVTPLNPKALPPSGSTVPSHIVDVRRVP